MGRALEHVLLADVADEYLYLGPIDSLTLVEPPGEPRLLKCGTAPSAMSIRFRWPGRGSRAERCAPMPLVQIYHGGQGALSRVWRALRRLAGPGGLAAVEAELVRAEPLDQGCEFLAVGVGKGSPTRGSSPCSASMTFQGRWRVHYEKASAPTSLVDAVSPAFVAPPTA